MLKSYILSALRNISRYRTYTLVNVLGLSIGLTLAILLLSFVRYEMSYECFHKKRNRIYRAVTKVRVSEGKTLTSPLTTGKVYNWVNEEIPEIETVLRLNPMDGDLLYKNEGQKSKHGLITDTTFFKVFDFRLKYGNRETAIRPGGIVLSEKVAKLFFQHENPVGKVINWKDEYGSNNNFIVTGVLEEIPENTHLKFDYLVSYHRIKNQDSYFDNISTHTYYVFHKGKNTPETINKLEKFLENKTNEKYSDWSINFDYSLQNLNDIHLHSDGMQYSLSAPGSIKSIYILGFLAFFVIIISVINYINLEISKAGSRTKEIGVRKAIGAQVKSLLTQFFGESFITVLISFGLAIGFAELLSPVFENLVSRNFSHQIYTLVNFALYIGIAVIVALLAGFYPAVHLASFKVANIFAAKSNTSNKKSPFYIFPVIIQFTIASFLIIGLFMVYKQLEYAKNKDLGFDQKHTIVLKDLSKNIISKYDVVADELKKIPSVIDVAGANVAPGSPTPHNILKKSKEQEGVLTKEVVVSNSYKDVLGLEILEGRYFSKQLKNDSNFLVLNQQAVKALGIENPVGKTIIRNEKPMKIIGVMKNYHVENIREEIKPVMHFHSSSWHESILLKIKVDNIKETINAIEAKLSGIDKEYNLNYYFLDEHFDAMYAKEEKMNKTSMYGALIVIILALSGLFALTSFIAQKIRKEIGIRKVVGANTKGIVFELVKDINKWVLLSNIIAWPLAFYFMENWLSNFAYRINISIWYFISGSFVVFCIAVITVAFRAYSAANENPAYILRNE